MGDNGTIPCFFFTQRNKEAPTIAWKQGNALSTECKVTHKENTAVGVGTFQLPLNIDNDKNELEQIAGQHFKRNVCFVRFDQAH